MCGDRAYPELGEIEAAALGDLAPNLFVVDVSDGFEAARFEHCGPVLASACSECLIGREVPDGLPYALSETLPYAFQAVVQSKKALITSCGAGEGGNIEFPFRCIIAPVGPKNGCVDHLAGAFSYKDLD